MAILFSGVTPVKILRVLDHMNAVCFTDRTYYHQRRYLEPAVISAWEAKQSTLLTQCRSIEAPITIGGDGPADSLGTLPNIDHTKLLTWQ